MSETNSKKRKSTGRRSQGSPEEPSAKRQRPTATSVSHKLALSSGANLSLARQLPSLLVPETWSNYLHFLGLRQVGKELLAQFKVRRGSPPP